jgi:hypothetical protein
MANERYLLGYTQTLQHAVFTSGPAGPHPYTIERQRERLLPQFRELDTAATAVPAAAAPNGEVVAVVRMNPQALSRSAVPDTLLKKADWRLIGSRPARVKPEGGRAAKRDDPALTTDLFVAATPAKLREALPLLMATERLNEKDPISQNFRSLESIRLMSPADRVKDGILETADDVEIVLHYEALRDSDWRGQFNRFAKSVGVKLEPGLEFSSRGLLFIIATATRAAAGELAKFTFLRAVRPLPEPRPLTVPKMLRVASSKSVLPAQPAVDPNLSIAIFDGGLPPNHPFGLWANAIEPPPDHDIGSPVAACQTHGLAVTSAALFGSIQPNTPAPRPFGKIDHYRVLGANTGDKKGLFRSLQVIDEILAQRDYGFVSLSIGPPDPIEDDDVNAWTTLLDDHLGAGTTLACVAVGNNGNDPDPKCRVMAPADSVNALGVGSCDTASGAWTRCDYSAKGPGRSPGLIKPDVLHFGGTSASPYLFAGINGTLLQETGTSFATPGLIRMAAGMRAHFGVKLNSMALKALVVHCADSDPSLHDTVDVGWGRAQHAMQDMTICSPGCVRIVYTGKLPASGVLRAPILVPPGLRGRITIRATLCYSCQTDPNTPGEYTRAGLDITFRPDLTKFTPDKITGKVSKNPDSDAFFKQHDHIIEEERRLRAQKWNTVMHDEKNKLTSKLNKPCFDLHYVARAPGMSGTPNKAPDIHYALVISLIQHKSSDLYEKVQAAFSTVVAPIEPLIEIEVPVTV